MTHLVGESGKARVIAFFLDSLIAFLAVVLLVGAIGSQNPVVSVTVLSFIYLFYFFSFEAIWSRTPGKWLQGLIVRKLDGSRCDLRGTFIRTLARILEANPILLGGIPAGIVIIASERKQRLGDLIAGTVVVSKRDAAEIS